MIGLKKLINFAGLVFLMASTYIFVDAFIAALMNGYRTVITINDYGEANIELVLICVLIPCALYFVYNQFKGK